MSKKLLSQHIAVISAATLAASIPAALYADTVIEEVVVTAQKREQNLQDVGLSVTALNETAMTRAGVEDISRIELVTPGVSFGFAGSDAKIAIRGASSNNTFRDNSSVAGFFVDGVYRPRAAQQSQAFFDVKRIEVLKGPQGTLYGRNTFAGAVNLYTRRPDIEDTAFGLKTAFSRFDSIRTEGFVNLPVSDSMALRFAAQTKTSGGHIENIGSGGDLGEEDSRNARLSMLWQPSDNVDMLLRYTSLSQGGTTPGIFSAEGLGAPVNVSGLTDIHGQFVDYGNPSPGSSGVDSAFDRPYVVNYNQRNRRDNSEDNVTLEVNWDIGAVSLKSLSSYTDFVSELDSDGDFSNNPGYPSYWDEAAESVTQELQLSSNSDGAYKWTAGLYYSKDELGLGYSKYVTQTNAANTSTGVDDNGTVTPAFDGTALIDPFGRGSFSDFSNLQAVETETLGIFFQSEWSVTDTLRLITGVRYNEEDKATRTFNGSSFEADGITNLPGVTQAGLQGRPIDLYRYTFNPNSSGGDTFEAVTWKMGFEWDINDASMLYANASTGFLSGGVNPNGSTFNQQESLAYELGMKSRFLDDSMQLNIALYRNEFTDLTTQELISPAPGVFQTISVNGGALDSNGLEVELTWLPVDKLMITATAAFMDSAYGKFGVINPFQLNNGQPVDKGKDDFIALDGTTPPWAPDVTFGLSVGYDFALGDYGLLTPFIQFYYSDEYNTDDVSLYSTQVQDAYSKTDVRIIWMAPETTWSAELFIENIEDEAVLARTNVGGNDLVQTSYLFPKSYGLKISYGY